MQDALNYIYYIFDRGVSFVFNDMLIFTNISVGWIMISVIVFSILISSILNLPHHMGNFSRFRSYGTESVSFYGNGVRHTYTRRVRYR